MKWSLERKNDRKNTYEQMGRGLMRTYKATDQHRAEEGAQTRLKQRQVDIFSKIDAVGEGVKGISNDDEKRVRRTVSHGVGQIFVKKKKGQKKERKIKRKNLVGLRRWET